MAEEETGFTFVDKRRAAAEAASEPSAPEPVVPEMSRQAAPDVLDIPEDDYTESDGADGPQAAPTTYDMIGYCINLLASQAWQKLGLLADPQTGEAQPDLDEAKLAIDAVGDLAARLDAAPETAIAPDLKRDLRTLINDLRLNYVSQRGSTSGV